MRRRHLTRLTTVALVLGVSGLAVTAPSDAASRTTSTIAVPAAAPIVNERFQVTGRVSTRFKRTVVLRRLDGKAWRTVARGSAASTGKFRFPVSTPVTRTYTVQVPAARHSGRAYASTVSRARTVTPVAQTGTTDALPKIAQRGTAPALATAAKNAVVARFSPARPGRAVTFRRQLGNGSWQKVATLPQRADGTASYFGPTTSGSSSYRFQATTAARSGAAALTTATATDTWGAADFADDFGGSSLDLHKWMYRDGTAASRSKSTNDRRSVSVGGGTLRMQVKLDPRAKNTKPSNTRYLNGQISSQSSFTFTHGVASARVKFPRHRGQHGSFWLQSPTYGMVPGDLTRSGAEIDAVEYFGQGYPKGGLATFLYYKNAARKDVKIGNVWAQATALMPKSDTWWNSYHVFTVKWTARDYTFYVDGRVLFTTNKGVSQAPEYLILSLLTSDWELPNLNLRTTPQQMNVDWVRVWK